MASSPSRTITKSPPATLHQPASPRFPSNSRKIAIAIDLSDESAFAVKWAVDNYIRPGDSVILLHVSPTSVLYGADWGAVDITISDDKQKMEDDFTNLTSAKANELALPLAEANVPYRVHIVRDHDMKERLCLEVERLGLSAVVMGSRGFGAVTVTNSRKGRLGSVTDYCVHHCVCPVIVVRFARGDNDPASDKDLHPVPEEEEEEDVFRNAKADGDKVQ